MTDLSSICFNPLLMYVPGMCVCVCVCVCWSSGDRDWLGGGQTLLANWIRQVNLNRPSLPYPNSLILHPNALILHPNTQTGHASFNRWDTSTHTHSRGGGGGRINNSSIKANTPPWRNVHQRHIPLPYWYYHYPATTLLVLSFSSHYPTGIVIIQLLPCWYYHYLASTLLVWSLFSLYPTGIIIIQPLPYYYYHSASALPSTLLV